MISIAPTSRIFILHEPISFHRQIEGLAAAVRQQMGKDPLSGSYFVFCSRSRRSLRILHFDGSGCWLCTKRLSQGSLGKCWPKSPGSFSPLLISELQQLLWGTKGSFQPAEKNWRHAA